MTRNDVTDIISAGAEVGGYTEGDILGRSRKVELCTIRAICCKLMYEELGMSTTSIGSRIGGRNHATVMNYLKRIDGWLETRDKFATDKYNKINSRWKEMCLSRTASVSSAGL